jgi:short-subunit dehydrogenase
LLKNFKTRQGHWALVSGGTSGIGVALGTQTARCRTRAVRSKSARKAAKAMLNKHKAKTHEIDKLSIKNHL